MPDSLGTGIRQRWAVRGVTLLELSLVLSVLLLFFSLQLQHRREAHLFSLADRAAAELREIVDAALLYRTHNQVWPVDFCVEEFLVTPTVAGIEELDDDCNGDGNMDLADISGVRRLLREGYIPPTEWRTELDIIRGDVTDSADQLLGGTRRALALESVLGGALRLQPVPTTGASAWRVASSSTSYADLDVAINTAEELADFAGQQGLRLYMELPRPFACMAHYIAALVPSSRVQNANALTSGNCTTLSNVGIEVQRRNEAYTLSEEELLQPPSNPTELDILSALRAGLLVLGGNVRLDAPGARVALPPESILSPYYGALRLAPYGIDSTQALVVETAVQFARLAEDPHFPSAGLAVLAARPGEADQAGACCVAHYGTSGSAYGTNYFPYGVAPYSPRSFDWHNNVLVIRPGTHVSLASTDTILAAATSSGTITVELWDYLRQYSTSIVAGQRELGQPAGLSYRGSHQVSAQVAGFAFAGSRDLDDPDNLVIGGLPTTDPSSLIRQRSALDLYNSPVVSLGPKTALRHDHVYVERLELRDVDFVLAHGARNWPWDEQGYSYASTPYAASLGPVPGWEHAVVDFVWPTEISMHNPFRMLSPAISDSSASASLQTDLLNMARDNSAGAAVNTTTVVIEASTVGALSCMQCIGPKCPTDPNPATVAAPC